MTTITFAIAQLCATDDCCDACGEDLLSGVCVFYQDGDGCFQLHPGCITPGDPVLDKAVESARLIMDGDKAEFLTAKVANADAELARLRAELEKARAELATLDISYKEAIHSIGVDRHNAERWQSECLNAREEARRLQALIERRRIEANDTRVNAAGWEERALRAERERDEAVSKIREHAEHVNYYGALYSQTELERRNIDEQREFYKDELAKAQTCADEMAALAWKWKYKADCQRATIRALVVAARAMADFPLLSFALRPEWTKRIRQSIKQAERGQAGKE